MIRAIDGSVACSYFFTGPCPPPSLLHSDSLDKRHTEISSNDCQPCFIGGLGSVSKSLDGTYDPDLGQYLQDAHPSSGTTWLRQVIFRVMAEVAVEKEDALHRRLARALEQGVNRVAASLAIQVPYVFRNNVIRCTV